MKIYETDIINTIISTYKIDIRSLSTIKYYKVYLELQLIPNGYKDESNLDEPRLFSITEGGFFVISINEGDYINDYRLYYTDLIKNLRDNKLKELGI